MAVDSPARPAPAAPTGRHAVDGAQPAWWRLAKRIVGYLVLTAFALVFLYPFVLSLASTIKSRAEVAAHPVVPWPQEFTERAWSFVLLHSDFPRWLLNSVIVTVSTVILALVVRWRISAR